jgi:hypothetical protein
MGRALGLKATEPVIRKTRKETIACKPSFEAHPCSPACARWRWRASLQGIDGSERIGFADLERLFAYLLQMTDSTASARDPPE